MLHKSDPRKIRKVLNSTFEPKPLPSVKVKSADPESGTFHVSLAFKLRFPFIDVRLQTFPSVVRLEQLLLQFAF